MPYNLAIAVDSSDESDWVDITALSSRTVDKINDKFDHSHLSAIDPDANSKEIKSLYYNEHTFNGTYGNTKHISFVHVNISSAPANLRNFGLFLSNLKHNFSIICCSETWFKMSTNDRFTPKGYEHIYDYRLKKEVVVLLFLSKILLLFKRDMLSNWI